MSEVKQAGKFGLIGILNTAIDFGILNVLNIVFGIPKIPSNIVSTTVAMSFSFIMNKTFVFNSKDKHYVRQAALFLTFTAFGLYVLQNLVILSLDIWTFPTDLAVSIVELIGLDGIFGEQFIRLNTAKLAATFVSLVWNYLTYKKYVFNK